MAAVEETGTEGHVARHDACGQRVVAVLRTARVHPQLRVACRHFVIGVRARRVYGKPVPGHARVTRERYADLVLEEVGGRASEMRESGGRDEAVGVPRGRGRWAPGAQRVLRAGTAVVSEEREAARLDAR